MTLQFAYWVPSVSGGIVKSNGSRKADWSFEANKRYIQAAENAGFKYAFFPSRFFSEDGGENQLEALALAASLAPVTRNIQLVTQVLSGLWHPGVVAKALSTLDHISSGRAGINLASGSSRLRRRRIK
ncbi:LLM class flavin-dependent oxidoreductase [Paenibacillus naphthalenovorans]|uniref:LLM class flavin-dependent oxidoreductase n=1 Tax=Paenibacillus naphthalenovorans TaxID=162209 RepID=UPI003D29372F